MKVLRVSLLYLFLVSFAGPAALAETVVVNFDDYEGGLAPIPPGYAGFTSWGSFGYSSTVQMPAYYPFSEPTYATSVGAPQPIVFGDPYVFTGAWFVGNPGNGVAFNLYIGGELVHTSEILDIDYEYQWLESGFAVPVEVVLVTYAYGINAWCMDDFTYETGGVANEDASWGAVKSLFR